MPALSESKVLNPRAVAYLINDTVYNIQNISCVIKLHIVDLSNTAVQNLIQREIQSYQVPMFLGFRNLVREMCFDENIGKF